MSYIHNFASDDERTAYESSTSYTKPYVALVGETVYYNKESRSSSSN